MLFSSTIFLFAFLPIVGLLYFALRGVRARNALLIFASLFFYAWGETGYVAILLICIALNYAFVLWIDRSRGRPSQRKILVASVAVNLLILASFKYTNFLADNLSLLLAPIGLRLPELEPVHLPIGISFFTFQALTYVVDVYRSDAPVQRNPLRVALYIALFPQLIAGPIVRYRQVAAQLARRTIGADDVAEGIRRFVIGLGKKVIIANTLALPADRIFAIPAGELTVAVAWFGVICFALQIYYDFAGYSDMAIGLGRCLGFDFPENFNWPYLARSVREFWRRWHISLSSWFRDYLYIPLGGNRQGALRTHLNLVAVFFLCGLWHGASWNFVVWGLMHGSFLVLERTSVGTVLARAPIVLQRSYTLIVVLIAWVFFRAADLPHALSYLAAMVGAAEPTSGRYPLVLFSNPEVVTILLLAALGAAPSFRRAIDRLREHAERARSSLEIARLAALGLILLVCAMSLASGTHNPFIYFRF